MILGLAAVLAAAFGSRPAAASESDALLRAEIDAYLVDEWRFSGAVQLWVPATELTISKDSIVGEGVVDTDLGDELGYRVTADARKRRWGVLLDGHFLELDGVATTLDQVMLQIGGFHRFGNPKTFVDAIVSVRVVQSDNEFGDGSVRRTWWEPVLGFRFSRQLKGKLRVLVRGDVGGFSLGSASDLTVQIEGLLLLRVGESVEVAAGYRFLDIDYDRGGLHLQQETHGPVVAVLVIF